MTFRQALFFDHSLLYAPRVFNIHLLLWAVFTARSCPFEWIPPIKTSLLELIHSEQNEPKSLVLIRPGQLSGKSSVSALCTLGPMPGAFWDPKIPHLVHLTEAEIVIAKLPL